MDAPSAGASDDLLNGKIFAIMNSEKSSDLNQKLGTPPEAHRINTVERVPGHENYYEKDGLRTYGDGEDHDHEPPVFVKNDD